MLLGNAGTDTVDYAERIVAVQIVADGASVSGNSADGASGARDAVGADVETLTEGRAATP